MLKYKDIKTKQNKKKLYILRNAFSSCMCINKYLFLDAPVKKKEYYKICATCTIR